MSKTSTYLHSFKFDISDQEAPENFTFPFCYEPHPLSILAVKQVQEYLQEQSDFKHNFGLETYKEGLVIGKMFGVLVVKDQSGDFGFLAAVSGKLAGTNQHAYFVPPIFDMLTPGSFFLEEEVHINQLNRRIAQLQQAEALKLAKQNVQDTRKIEDNKLSELRKLHKLNKANRKISRDAEKDTLPEAEYEYLIQDLIKQSYRDQHHYAVQKELSADIIQTAEDKLNSLLEEIEALKLERKTRSATLQNQLFDQYQFLNANKQTKSVLDIFQEKKQIVPPAGAGECAAPKLLQYAYQHELQPICMAEFWWGASPNQEVRKHLHYYPACRGKCEPILDFMLDGLQVDPNPLLENPAQNKDLEIIFEDEEIIVVNKPEEFLSVPGIHVQDSVQSRIQKLYPNLDSPLIIHRLDMSTSGILLLAKTKHAHQFIQEQFINHSIEKRYTALLEGVIEKEEGLIDFPMRVDLDDRPRQVLCYSYGKEARTKYKVVGIEGNRTKIHYFPLTGRTHQLRVHSAHASGLNAPIVGDDLYGTRANRLHLHAGYIKFIHPGTQAEMSFEVADPF